MDFGWVGVKGIHLQEAEEQLAFPGGSAGKESARNARDLGSIPGLGKCPRGGHGNTLQNSCLEEPVDRGTWQATVHGVVESWKWLNG